MEGIGSQARQAHAPSRVLTLTKVFLCQGTAGLALEAASGHALLKSRFHQMQLCQASTVYNGEGFYLFWSIFLYECFKNGLGFWQKFMCTFAFLVILAGYPELDVLLTELSFQKLCEGIQPSYKRESWIALKIYILIRLFQRVCAR